MACLWAMSDDEGWIARELGAAERHALGSAELGGDGGGVDLVRYGDPATGRERWALVAAARARARVNGEEVVTGLRSIRERDQIEVDGSTWYFSVEQRAEVERYPAGLSGATCRLCGLPMEAGQAAVRCPRCQLWHHEMPDRRCWTALRRCGACSLDTTGESYAWTPAVL